MWLQTGETGLGKPIRQWVKSAGDKPSTISARLRKHGMTLETKRGLESGGLDANEYNEQRAVAYAEWLAARDGIALPTTKARAAWSGFYSAWHKRSHARWREPGAVYCRRVQAVEWGREFPVYATRKDGRRGAYLHDQWVCALRIEIPHWDFEHPPLDLCEARE